MNKKSIAAAFAALALGFPAIAQASVILGSDMIDVDGHSGKKSYTLEDFLNFRVKDDNEKVKFSITLTPDKGNKGSVSDIDAFFQSIGGKHKNGIEALSVSSVTKAKNGGITYTFFDTFNKGRYAFSDSFSLTHNWKGTIQVQIAAVPEPETYALMGIGLVGLMLARRRNKAARPTFNAMAL